MWRGFEAWLVSEGDRLPEYLVTVHDEPGETPIVQCWVPCTVGEKFTVFWKDHNSGIETVAYIMLDCYTVPGRFLHGSGTAWRSGARITDKTERPFVFRDASACFCR
ncbi:hypothetical protein FISHEDRAFT_53445 [Fistulina hepatica ATCC 64428]|nr:hypothetical protein FISHEDRAFT_53445 [Fistulina hepatica ATCC 64428]